MEETSDVRRVCVTGAGGFVASWLVKLLLSKGYTVHGTVREPSDGKNTHLKKFENAAGRLKLFKADVLDFEAVAAAIAGCEGVFHVASPVPSNKVSNPEVELIKPAVEGTINVLKACSQEKICRVVFVSSAAAVQYNPNWKSNTILDEDCWSDTEYCRKTENWYFLSKTMAEEAAFKCAKMHGLNFVSACPPMIVGPLLQSKLNASSLYLINMLNGSFESVKNRLMHIVDVRDFADALLLLHEKPEATGRYNSAAHHLTTCDLIGMLKSIYPDFNYPRQIIDDGEEEQCVMTSEKLKRLGWNYRDLKQSLVDSVEYYKMSGLLDKV